MPQVCILTDESAQFDQAGFPGFELVRLIHLAPNAPALSLMTPRGQRIEAPAGGAAGAPPETHPFTPSVEALRQVLLGLSSHFNEVVFLPVSGQIHPRLLLNANKAAESLHGRLSIKVVDSQAISVGLGWLVQAAAGAAAAGERSSEINRLVQNRITHLYTVFCTRSLGHLARLGSLDPAHGVIGELLSLAPVMILENGRLIPTHKARNARHLVDILQEFVDEFYDLQQVVILRGSPLFGGELSQLRERLHLSRPEIPVHEQLLEAPLAGILGTRTLGMILKEAWTS
jgi:DegV family protein with EDD domain